MIPQRVRDDAQDLRGRGAAYFAYVFTFGILGILTVWLRTWWMWLLVPATLACAYMGVRRYRQARELEARARAEAESARDSLETE